MVLEACFRSYCMHTAEMYIMERPRQTRNDGEKSSRNLLPFKRYEPNKTIILRQTLTECHRRRCLVARLAYPVRPWRCGDR